MRTLGINIGSSNVKAVLLDGDEILWSEVVPHEGNFLGALTRILSSRGVIARIGQIQRGLGGVQLLVPGEQRVTSLEYNLNDGYLTAVVIPTEEMAPLNEQDAAFEALHKETRERAQELGEIRGLPEEVVHQVLDAVDEPGKFADLVAGYIELPVPE